MTDQFLVKLHDITKAVIRNYVLEGSGCTLGPLRSMFLLAKTSTAKEQVAQRDISSPGKFSSPGEKKAWLICLGLRNSLTSGRKLDRMTTSGSSNPHF